MKRRELEIALRAAGRVSREREFFLIGSQAVHVHCRRPPAEVLLSQECDLYPRNHPAAGDLMRVELGRGSKFARRHGFYVDVVSPEIAGLPVGWENRLKPLRVGNVTAYGLDIYDLLVSKLAAGRLKDLEFAAAVLKRRIANVPALRQRVNRCPFERERWRLRSQLRVVLENLRR